MELKPSNITCPVDTMILLTRMEQKQLAHAVFSLDFWSWLLRLFESCKNMYVGAAICAEQSVSVYHYHSVTWTRPECVAKKYVVLLHHEPTIFSKESAKIKNEFPTRCIHLHTKVILRKQRSADEAAGCAESVWGEFVLGWLLSHQVSVCDGEEA